MMDKETLCKFADPTNPKICGPFSFGEYSYATNGHILVRVARMDDVPEWEAINGGAAKMFAGLDVAALGPLLVDIPDFEQLAPDRCYTCKGSGKVSECPECGGEGEVTVGNDFNYYECECLTCNGNGHVSGGDSVCQSCYGSGTKQVVKRVPMGEAGFSTKYLNMMRDLLPGARIAPTKAEGANYFMFNGGDGLIMPMRP
jgi:hypothetical protein